MGKCKKLLTWAWLLNKRLFRKPTFLIILLLIPVLVFGYGFTAEGESGVVTIVLAQEGNDELASQVIDDLLGSSDLIYFQKLNSAQEAEECVAHGKADAAWIFPEDMQERLERFVKDPDSDNSFIRVIQREEKILLMLTRELLGGKAIELCSEKVYLNFVRNNVSGMAELSDDELLRLYHESNLTGDLFTYEQTDGTVVNKEEAAGYLMTPVRGLLGVVIVLCGLATAMFFVQDQASGTFAWLPERRRPFAELGCQMVSVVDVSVAALISLLAVGLAGQILRELLVLVMYSVCVAVFSMMMRRLCGSIRGLGVMLPLLVVVMLLVCPVFFDIGMLRNVQFLFPPTYYINAMFNVSYLLYMPIYTVVCLAIYIASGKLLKRT